ncbi:hypothetical protein OPU71_20350 [Niveibacterium sp. 24ML]|uniref:hypothetical protein n=1 Tax=Niveibacterium sp. 24ML TaxID=2985512 RepID=UPI00226F69AF|nr:hypothetical protein [Niveibacterium sp. 24ML]MCX9158480.1 hypothetical protein [Niveibacterium sp. 24ML]
MSGVRELERITLRPGLGLRLEDPFGGALGSGLKVTATPPDSGMPPQRLQPTPSGHWVAHGLPGLRGWENAETGDPLALAREFEIKVEDPQARVLPTRFRLTLPQNRLARLRCPGPLPGDPPIEHFPIPLFATPARPAPAHWACLRASLRELPLADPDKAAPAAWALLEVRQGATLLARGMADARGELMVCFAYPEPADAGGVARSAFDHQWPLTLTVRYQRQPSESIPLLCALLAQPACQIARSVAGAPPAPVLGADLPVSLRYGQPLAAATPGARALFVQP